MRPTFVLANGRDSVKGVGPTPVLQIHKPKGTCTSNSSSRVPVPRTQLRCEMCAVRAVCCVWCVLVRVVWCAVLCVEHSCCAPVDPTHHCVVCQGEAVLLHTLDHALCQRQGSQRQGSQGQGLQGQGLQGRAEGNTMFFPASSCSHGKPLASSSWRHAACEPCVRFPQHCDHKE